MTSFTLRHNSSTTQCGLIHQNTSTLVCCTNENIYLFFLTQNKPSVTLFAHTKDILYILELPNNLLASSSEDATIIIWSLTSFKPLHILKGHDDWVTYLKLLSNDRLASCSIDNTIKIWNYLNEKCIFTYEGHTDWVNSICQLDSDLFSSCGDDCCIKIWSINKSKEIQIDNNKAIKLIEKVDKERLIWCDIEGIIVVYNITENKEELKMNLNRKNPIDMIDIGDSRYAITFDNFEIDIISFLNKEITKL